MATSTSRVLILLFFAAYATSIGLLAWRWTPRCCFMDPPVDIDVGLCGEGRVKTADRAKSLILRVSLPVPLSSGSPPFHGSRSPHRRAFLKTRRNPQALTQRLVHVDVLVQNPGNCRTRTLLPHLIGRSGNLPDLPVANRKQREAFIFTQPMAAFHIIEQGPQVLIHDLLHAISGLEQPDSCDCIVFPCHMIIIPLRQP